MVTGALLIPLWLFVYICSKKKLYFIYRLVKMI